MKQHTAVRILLTPDGHINLNWAAMERFKDITTVIRLFDRINSLITIDYKFAVKVTGSF
jgi:hypothetical protein